MKAKVILAAVLVVLIAAGVLVYWYTLPALKVGSFSVSKKEYQSLVTQAKADKLDEASAKQTIIDDYKLQEAAKKTGISYSAGEAKQIAADYYQVEKPNDWQLLYGKRVLIKNLVNFKKEGGVRGALLNYPFARNFAFGTEGAGPEFGTKAAIDADKAYALAQVQADNKDLVDGKTTADALVVKLQSDGRLTYGGVSNSSKHFIYTDKGKWLTFRDGDDRVSLDYLAKVRALGVGISPISTEKTTTAGYSMVKGYEAAGTDIAYRFYKIDEIAKADPTFAANFDSANKAVKVVSRV
jgi:hypothetical protein